MEALVSFRNFVILAIRPAAYSLICVYLFLVHHLSRYGWDRPAVKVALLAAPALTGLAWQAAVAISVPEPYLVSIGPSQVFHGLITNAHQDEVFHIPQAQKYCESKWLEWDDKITTPPGLYVLSYLSPPPFCPLTITLLAASALLTPFLGMPLVC